MPDVIDIEIRQSEIGTYLECRRRWEYEYLKRIEFARSANRPAPNLSLGTLVHGIVEHLWTAGEDAAKAYLATQILKVGEAAGGPLSEEWLKEFALADAMLKHYKAWLAEGNTMREKVVLIEHQMRVEWRPGVFVTGKLDRLAYDEILEENVLIDVKTCKSFMRAVNHARQLKTYAVLLRREGIQVGRLETEQIRKVLGTGNAKPPFVERSAPLHVNDDILDAFEQQVEAIIDDMLALRARYEVGDTASLYANPTGDCDWKCEYLPLCAARENCENEQFIEVMSYRPRKEDHL